MYVVWSERSASTEVRRCRLSGQRYRAAMSDVEMERVHSALVADKYGIPYVPV